MLLFVLAFLGGTLTILSPCVLPVIPFVFAHYRGDGVFMVSGRNRSYGRRFKSVNL
jgi:cytochrome c biogenesis protein CcdA